jgi:hypothetical protein
MNNNVCDNELIYNDEFDTILMHIGFQSFACETIENFTNNFFEYILSNKEKTIEYETVYGFVFRTCAWMKAIGKLKDDPGHFQPALAASRSLFEMAIDLVLLNNKKEFYKLKAWEDSSELNYLENSMGCKEEYDTVHDSNWKKQVNDNRKQFWENTHPLRWTQQNIKDDAKAADKIKQSGFEEYYKYRYKIACWNVHGSGLVSVRNIFQEKCAKIFKNGIEDSVKFSFIIYKEVFSILNYKNNNFENDFNEINKQFEEIRNLQLLNKKELLKLID